MMVFRTVRSIDGDCRSGAGEANFWHRFFPKNTKGIRGLVMRIIFESRSSPRWF
jgi:hypothetical protein